MLWTLLTTRWSHCLQCASNLCTFCLGEGAKKNPSLFEQGVLSGVKLGRGEPLNKTCQEGLRAEGQREHHLGHVTARATKKQVGVGVWLPCSQRCLSLYKCRWSCGPLPAARRHSHIIQGLREILVLQLHWWVQQIEPMALYMPSPYSPLLFQSELPPPVPPALKRISECLKYRPDYQAREVSSSLAMSQRVRVRTEVKEAAFSETPHTRQF